MITQDLIHCDEYTVCVFPTTTQALKAEQVMKAHQALFIMIPTPREISNSCGIALKFFPETLEDYRQILLENEIKISGIYNMVEKGPNQILVQLAPQSPSSPL